jgi:hypothetical protein
VPSFLIIGGKTGRIERIGKSGRLPRKLPSSAATIGHSCVFIQHFLSQLATSKRYTYN